MKHHRFRAEVPSGAALPPLNTDSGRPAADADAGASAENSVAFYLTLRETDVSAEVPVYERGPQGWVWHGLRAFLLDGRLADWLTDGSIAHP